MDDKTAKIPSLKEFEKAHRQQTQKKGTPSRNRTQDKSKRSVKGDTHRVELKETADHPVVLPQTA